MYKQNFELNTCNILQHFFYVKQINMNKMKRKHTAEEVMYLRAARS